MTDILPVLAIIGLAGSKYAIAVALIFAGNFTFLESISMAIFGGMLGVIIFAYGGDLLKKTWRRFFPPKKRTEKLRINRFLRAVVWVRQRYGLAGIAFLTPLILTVPVGAMLANSLYKNKLQIFGYMFAAFTFWSVLLCGTYHALGIELSLPWMH